MLKFRSILAAGLLALFALPAFAASVVWQTAPTQIRTATGTVAAGGKALFYLAGTTTDYTVYTDNALTVPHPQPVVANSNGVFPTVFLPYVAGGYRVRITTSANVVITDIDGIANAAPPSGGGGGGITVATEQVFQPGWTVFLLQAGPVTGFVRLNGRTIGNPTSGASERANADAAAVYAYYWTNCADAQCPVSTGRGGSAAADFAANKTLTLPDMRGRAPFGLDDMGNSAASRFGASVVFGSGTSTTPNASGGSSTHTMTIAQMPAHDHGGATAGTTPSNLTEGDPTFASNFGAGAISGAVSETSDALDHTHAITSQGGGAAHPTISPFILGGWYAKI